MNQSRQHQPNREGLHYWLLDDCELLATPRDAAKSRRQGALDKP